MAAEESLNTGMNKEGRRMCKSMRHVIRTIFSGLLFSVAMLLLAAGTTSAGSPHEPGKLEGYRLVGGPTLREVEQLLAAHPLARLRQQGRESLGERAPAANPVKMYVVYYRTPGPKGRLVRASGLVMIPDPQGKRQYPIVSFQHGTIYTRDHAPSYPEKCAYTPYLKAFAGMGYVLSIPDYIGMGRSKLRHPYAHAETEASASRDMLRAAKTLCSKLGVQLNGKLFLTGYSQGGRATMALQRLIEDHHADEFPITASAPGGGPYDHYLFWTNDLRNPNQMSTVVAAFMIVAYNRIYGFNKDLGEIFKPPYHRYVDSLFDGTKTEEEIDKRLPVSLRDMLRPEFIKEFTQGRNPFYVAFTANNTNTWRPKAPIRLFHARGDEANPFEMSQLTAKYMKSLGVDVRVVDVGNYKHVDAFVYSLMAIKKWFDTF
jgi:predicted esterase